MKKKPKKTIKVSKSNNRKLKTLGKRLKSTKSRVRKLLASIGNKRPALVAKAQYELQDPSLLNAAILRYAAAVDLATKLGPGQTPPTALKEVSEMGKGLERTLGDLAIPDAEKLSKDLKQVGKQLDRLKSLNKQHGERTACSFTDGESAEKATELMTAAASHNADLLASLRPAKAVPLPPGVASDDKNTSPIWNAARAAAQQLAAKQPPEIVPPKPVPAVRPATRQNEATSPSGASSSNLMTAATNMRAWCRSQFSTCSAIDPSMQSQCGPFLCQKQKPLRPATADGRANRQPRATPAKPRTAFGKQRVIPTPNLHISATSKNSQITRSVEIQRPPRRFYSPSQANSTNQKANTTNNEYDLHYQDLKSKKVIYNKSKDVADWATLLYIDYVGGLFGPIAGKMTSVATEVAEPAKTPRQHDPEKITVDQSATIPKFLSNQSRICDFMERSSGKICETKRGL